MNKLQTFPVAVIGAGPVGLAAAAHLLERGLEFVLLEAGPAVGSALREWAHVKLFSPWAYNVDPAAERWLRASGWLPPVLEEYPTGGEIVARYLTPLSELPGIANRTKVNARVVGISRKGRDKMKSDRARAEAPFRIRYVTPAGEAEVLARAVIDTSGTWQSPNPLGSEGMPARGERDLQSFIRYGIPDVLGVERSRYAGKRVLVAGSGHSAFNALVDLAKLTQQEPATSVIWVVRRATIDQVFGGGERDQLAARGELGTAVRQLLESGRLKLVVSFHADAVERSANGIYVRSGGEVIGPIDEIIVATGFRPDFSYLRELQLGLDPIVETTPSLAPMIDPNLHSCGTVRPHGHVELTHPEPGFYIAGMKSYGRAPTFLMRTGYEQVRSIVAALAGDLKAANRVELVLPETGVCSVQRFAGEESTCCRSKSEEPGVETSDDGERDSAGGDGSTLDAAARRSVTPEPGCCGGAPRSNATACCRKDEEAKAAGEAGCGCGGKSEATKSDVAGVPATCCR